MDDEGAGGGGGGGVATDIAGRPGKKRGQAEGEVGPSPHVFGLFLAPDYFGRGRVAGKDLQELGWVEGVDLFEADDGGMGDLMLLLIILQVIKNFTGAENDPTGALGNVRIGQNFSKGAVGKIGHGAGGAGIAEKTFGRKND